MKCINENINNRLGGGNRSRATQINGRPPQETSRRLCTARYVLWVSGCDGDYRQSDRLRSRCFRVCFGKL